MKVRINTTSFCFYLPFCLYAEIDFGVRMIRTAQRNKALSSSARAPPMEKHDILHSFN